MTVASTDEVLVGLGPDAEIGRRRFPLSDRARAGAMLFLLVVLQVGWIGALLFAAYTFIFGSNV